MENEKEYQIQVLQRLTKIETLLEDFKGVEAKANDAYVISISNKKAIEKIEDNNKWAFRTALGAVIVSLINILSSILQK